MKVVDPGHIYELDHLCSEGKETLTFIKRSGGAIQYEEEYPGTNTQEVIRCLIDRTIYLNDVLPCEETEDAVYFLRMALKRYEDRAYRRKQEKLNRKQPKHQDGYSRGHGEQRDIPFSEYRIEERPVGEDGHIII